MNFFSKNRFISWALIILVIINVSALLSFLFFTSPKQESSCCPADQQQCVAFRDELKLSAAQEKLVAEINNRYMESAAPVAADIKSTRAALLNELETEQPDSIRMDSLSNRIALLQVKIQHENISQYLALKKVCTPQQAQKLSTLYRELYGCPMQNEPGKHRYRNGQGNSGRMKCE
jgi:Spy/CpxP family protein refolding chaperone